MRESLLAFEEAWEKVMRAVPKPRREKVGLNVAEGRILARDVRADRDLPPFDRAALDGYAVRTNSPFGREETLPIVAEVAAGQKGPRILRAGTCVRIWTGAAVPAGAQGIIPVERAYEEHGRAVLEGPLETRGSRRQGIADRGEDAQRGQPLLKKGRPISTAALAVLAGVGIDPVPVYSDPRIAVVVTGNELVRPSTRPKAVQIRSTNDYVVAAIARSVGVAEIRQIGIVEDDPARLRRAIRRGFANDVLVITGGISMGRFDLVPGILRELGVRIDLHRIAIRPGKPFLFGVRAGGGRRTTVFGLPGNPVSTLVTSVVFLAPFLRAWRGDTDPDSRHLYARLERPIRRGGGMRHFVPCRLRLDADGVTWATELRLRGSGDYSTVAEADGFLRIPGDHEEHVAGTSVRVDPLPDAIQRRSTR